MNKEKALLTTGVLLGGFLLYKGLRRAIVTYVYNTVKGGGNKMNYIKSKGLRLS